MAASEREHECAACGERASVPCFEAREMLLGTRECFHYRQCSACGSLQLDAPPIDLSPYYPPHYFSFRPQHRLARDILRGPIDRRRVAHALGRWNPIGALANRVCRPLDYVGWVRIAGLDARARVLDVGGGSGRLAVRMAHGGFARCLCLDPFATETVRYANGAEVRREDIVDYARVSGERFDLVMFHHSLEHLRDPHAALAAARALITPAGCVLLRLPLAGGFAWRTYGQHWYQLDAPRHLFVPTREGVERLAARTGFEVAHVVYDSTVMQFVGSELYARGIPMNAPARDKKIFDRARLARFARETARLNALEDGDQAIFWLRPRAAT